MELTIKFLPPYCRKGEQDQHRLVLEQESIELGELAFYLDRHWGHRLNYPLIDERKLLTAEFLVNGKHASLSRRLQDGDLVAVIPYIGGG